MQKKEVSMKEYSELMSLDRHFIWADYFKREHFKNLDKNFKFKEITDIGLFLINPVGMNMCYWYATLYVVLEGLDSCDIDYKEIEKEVADIKNSLRLFRNVIFHHSKGYFDSRLFEIMKDKDSRKKILIIHSFLDEELQDRIKAIRLKKDDNSFRKLFSRN
jgi:hypothetical protein